MNNKYQIHKEICGNIHLLYKSKNSDYGDSFSKARKDIPHYTLGKIYDKFSRFMNLDLGSDQKVKEETIEDTLLDMANYCIMEVTERRYAKQNQEEVIDVTCYNGTANEIHIFVEPDDEKTGYAFMSDYEAASTEFIISCKTCKYKSIPQRDDYICLSCNENYDKWEEKR